MFANQALVVFGGLEIGFLLIAATVFLELRRTARRRRRLVRNFTLTLRDRRGEECTGAVLQRGAVLH